MGGAQTLTGRRDRSSSVATGAKNQTEPQQAPKTVHGQQRARTTSNRALGPGHHARALQTHGADGAGALPEGVARSVGTGGPAAWSPREARTCGWHPEAAESGSFPFGDLHPFVWRALLTG